MAAHSASDRYETAELRLRGAEQWDGRRKSPRQCTSRFPDGPECNSLCLVAPYFADISERFSFTS